MLISIVGTLITDNLSDNFGVSLVVTTIAFSFALAATFAAWYASEGTLSIHTIFTTRREAFYWLTVLFTFALGTAAGDLTAERLALGYWQSALIFGGLIAVVYVSHVRFALNAVLAFWLAYILTRPLGASIGDYLSQPAADGGRGWGTTVTSVVFLLTILAVVVFLTITKRDVIEAEPMLPVIDGAGRARVLVVANKTAATPALVDAVRVRAAAGPADFVMLVPNPAHLAFDRVGHDTTEGEHLLAEALPSLEQAAGTPVEGRVATSPNAFDDIVAELERRELQRDHPRDPPEPRLALAARRPRPAARPPRLSADDRHRDALACSGGVQARERTIRTSNAYPDGNCWPSAGHSHPPVWSPSSCTGRRTPSAPASPTSAARTRPGWPRRASRSSRPASPRPSRGSGGSAPAGRSSAAGR